MPVKKQKNKGLKIGSGGYQTKRVKVLPGPHLIHSTQIFKEDLGPVEQSLIFWADDDVTNVSLGAKRIQKKFLPVRQTKRRQNHKVVLVAHQEGGNGQRFRRLISA